MAERGSIVMDIRAQVSGYEQSLRKLQAEFAKVDPGSQIGKSLSRAIQTAEIQLKALSKNLTPRVSNETQIDNTIQKVNNLGESIQNVTHLMQKITVNDINFDIADASISELISRLHQLETQLDTAISSGCRDAIANTQELSNAFQQLGINIEGKTKTEIFDELIQKSKEASDAVYKAEQAVKKAENVLASKEINITKIEENPIYDKDKLNQQFKDMAKDYTAAMQLITEPVEQGLQNLFPKNEALQEKILSQFTGGLTPDTLRERIEQLKVSVLEELKKAGTTMSITDIYKNLFGTGIGKANNSGAIATVFQQLFPKEDLAQLKEQFSQIIQSLTTQGLSSNVAQKITELISKNDIQAALRMTIKEVDQAYKTLEGKMIRARQEVVEATGAVGTAKDNLSIAQKQELHINILGEELEKRLLVVETENQALKQEIVTLRQEIQNRKDNTISTIHKNSDIQNNAAQEFTLSSEAASAYKSQLEEVKEKEKLVGKIEGIAQRWFSIYAAVRMVTNAVKSIIATVKELDKTITEIAIVTKMDQSQLWDQMGQYTAIAKEYAASISGVYKVSQLYYQQGLEQADVMALTTETLKMARISGLDYAEATDYMTNAIRSFKMEMTDAQRVVDVYSAIAASSATNVTELAKAMSKTASSAEAVGSSFENTTAMMAVMIGNTVPYN